jgi:hypothetical protein
MLFLQGSHLLSLFPINVLFKTTFFLQDQLIDRYVSLGRHLYSSISDAALQVKLNILSITH